MNLELQLAVASFLAGVLTVLAPCIIPVLPIVIGGSTKGNEDRSKPIVITLSLIVSIAFFTLLLRASTALIELPVQFWQLLSGSILILFGIFTLIPSWWDKISIFLNLSSKSNRLIEKSASQNGIWGDILVGASLGPVFSSCSPTYAVIIGILLTGTAVAGLFYLFLYLLGLGLVMLAVAIGGQMFIRRMGWATNPHGWFKRVVAIIFILVGLAVITGFDKSITAWVVDGGLYNWIIDLETALNGL